MFILCYGYVAFEKPICKYFTNKDVKALLQSASGITKCDSYYKVRRSNSMLKRRI